MGTVGPVVHIVDDDDGLRDAVSRLLSAMGFEARQHDSVGAFLLADAADEAGCVLLDVCMPGPSGLDLQLALSRRESSLPIIFLTGQGDIPMSSLAMKRGAVDFLTKPVDKEQLLEAIGTALQRDADARISRESRMQVRQRYQSLTAREKTVFSQVVSGKLNKQIADVLGTCERTVKSHRANVMDKMQASSVADLVHLAIALGSDRIHEGRQAASQRTEAVA